MLSQKYVVTARQCYVKWYNLLRTYKATVDLKKSTGQGQTRFHFFDAMDEVMGDKPTISCPNAIGSLKKKRRSSDKSAAEASETPSNADTFKVVKDKKPTTESEKRQWRHEEKIAVIKEKNELKLKLHLEKKELKKLMMEEAIARKRKLLEDAQAFKMKIELEKIAFKREIEKQRIKVETDQVNAINQLLVAKK